MPENKAAVGDNWLLKLHGSVSEPSSIVLTRDDYLGYQSNKDALSALVKAHLLTHHLLFVGFGLADDHFHEIVHDVRRALPPGTAKRRELGTVLSLFDDPSQELVWSGVLDILPMSATAPPRGAGASTTQTAMDAAGRELEIFLDMMASYAADNHSYLLAPAYDQRLTDSELRLRENLLSLAREPRTHDTAEVWAVIDQTLSNLGYDRNANYRDRPGRDG